MAEPSPVVSVIVVCYNEERRLRACLDSLRAQDFAEPWELLIVDNRSTDATNTMAKEAAVADSRIRVIENDTRVLSSGRNAGWRAAQAALVAYTDADCIVPTHWIRILVDAFRRQKESDPQLAGVGGGNYQPGDTPFYRALSIMLKSPFGNRGTTQTESFSQGRYVPSLAALNVLYDKEALESVGGYDAAMFPRVGEDEDLNSRLAAAGRRVFFVPGCDVLHFWRDNVRGWCKNMYLYGFGRARLRHRHPARRRLVDLLCLAVPGAMVLALFSWLCWLCLVPLAGYLAVIAAASLTGSVKAGATGLALRVFALFLGTHLWYGMGFVAGALNRRQ